MEKIARNQLNYTSSSQKLMSTLILSISICSFFVTGAKMSVLASCISNCTQTPPCPSKFCFKFRINSEYQRNITECQNIPRCSFSGQLPFKFEQLLNNGYACSLKYNYTVFGNLYDANICQRLENQAYQKEPLSGGAIAGIVIGCLIVVFIVYCCVPKEANKIAPEKRKITTFVQCPVCAGSNRAFENNSCPYCAGRGGSMQDVYV